jgi:hypothetical protein
MMYWDVNSNHNNSYRVAQKGGQCWKYGGKYRCADNSPTLADCCFFVIYALVVRWNTKNYKLHATDAVVPLARSFYLGPGISGACNVVSVARPSPCARLPHHHVRGFHRNNVLRGRVSCSVSVCLRVLQLTRKPASSAHLCRRKFALSIPKCGGLLHYNALVHQYFPVGERPHSGFPPSAHAASGIPPKLHQSDNSDHTKRQFKLVRRLCQSSISNYATCSACGLLCVQCGIPGQNGVQCKPTSELLMWGRYPHIDTYLGLPYFFGSNPGHIFEIT